MVLVTLSYACDQDLNRLLIYLATSRFVVSLMSTLDSITRALPKGWLFRDLLIALLNRTQSCELKVSPITIFHIPLRIATRIWPLFIYTCMAHMYIYNSFHHIFFKKWANISVHYLPIKTKCSDSQLQQNFLDSITNPLLVHYGMLSYNTSSRHQSFLIYVCGHW